MGAVDARGRGVFQERLGGETGVVVAAVADDVGAAVEVEDDGVVLRGFGRWGWCCGEPGSSDPLGANGRALADGPGVPRAGRRFGDDEASFLSAGGEGCGGFYLDYGSVVEEDAEETNSEGLLVGPFGVLAQKGGDEADEPVWYTSDGDGDCEERPDGFAGLSSDEGRHSV